MSAFMKSWVPQEHQLRKEVTTTMASIKHWLDESYKQDLENFLKFAANDRKLRKKISGATKTVKINLKVDQNRNFACLKTAYENLKCRVEQMADDVTADSDLANFVRLEHILLDYLNHWTPRIHTEKPQVGKNIASTVKSGNNSSVKRFKKEREEKRAVQRQFIDNAPEDPFTGEEPFMMGAMETHNNFARCA